MRRNEIFTMNDCCKNEDKREKRSCGGKGYKGDKGDKGDTGDKGVCGDKGDKGDKGVCGDKGDKGPRGDIGDKGDKGTTGDKGDKGTTGDKGQLGDKGPHGDKGATGDVGPRGPPGITESCRESLFVFSSSNPVRNDDFIGCGTSSTHPLPNTVIVPYSFRVTEIAFYIRELSHNIPYTATLWVNGLSSTLSATIVNGSVSTSVIGKGLVLLSALDTLTVKVTYADGCALAHGVCIILSNGP